MRLFAHTFSSLRTYDWLLAAIVFVLVSIGFAAIYSVDLSRGGGETLIYFPKQLLAFFLGAIVFFLGGRFHIALYYATARVFFFIASALLILVLFFGQTIRGTTGWFVLGPLSFQPAEVAKAALILLLGYIVARVGRRFDRIQYIIATALPAFFLAALVLLQPDLGSASVLLLLWVGVLIVTAKKKWHLGAIAGFFVVVGIIGWLFFFQEYQRERFLTFFYPDRDPLGAGYNVAQSVIAVGAGKVFGRGLGFGSQSQLRFLPEAQTDFIFSVIAEELGFLGAFAVLVLYGLLLFRLISVARSAPNDFGAYTVFGIAWLFFVHMTLNIGAAIGLLPVTGVTLPFLSYGGSSLLMNFFLLGIVQSVAQSRRLGLT